MDSVGWLRPQSGVPQSRDPDDDKVIEAALAGGAEYVVTGDEDLLTLRQSEGLRFVAPRDFLAVLA